MLILCAIDWQRSQKSERMEGKGGGTGDGSFHRAMSRGTVCEGHMDRRISKESETSKGTKCKRREVQTATKKRKGGSF